MNNATVSFQEGSEVNSDEWNARMRDHGEALTKHKGRHVIFVHGTFVGDDPIAFFDIISGISDNSTLKALIGQLRHSGKDAVDIVLEDSGNYTTNYVATFGKAIGGNLCEHSAGLNPFVWSSGNYHRARLDGTIMLARELAQVIKDKFIQPDERILLWGHSHAGQLFALLTVFLEGGNQADQLFSLLGDMQAEFKAALQVLTTVYLDFVTFGTPVRYAWGRYNRYRLLPIINHRHDSDLDVLAILTTHDGDYVQQWGVEGTDMPPIGSLTEENKLSAILGDRGAERAAFKASLENKARRRPHHADGAPAGENILVDYKDNITLPNPVDSIKKVFGHGIYTREKVMLFNLGLVVTKFYPI